MDGAAHLASLVLGDSVLGVLPALLALAVGPAGFRDVDLSEIHRQLTEPQIVRVAIVRSPPRTPQFQQVFGRSVVETFVAAERNCPSSQHNSIPSSVSRAGKVSKCLSIGPSAWRN